MKQRQKVNKYEDFKQKRKKVGKVQQKARPINEGLQVKTIKQVETTFTKIETILHQTTHQSVSIRKQGYQQLLFYLAKVQKDQAKEYLSLGAKILDIVFLGLNDENEQICRFSVEILKILPNTQVIQLNQKLFNLKMHLIMNTNFLDNRRYVYEGICQQHIQFMDVLFIKDTIAGMEVPTIEQKAIEICLWLLVHHRSQEYHMLESNKYQIDYFNLQQQNFLDYDIDEIIAKLVIYITKNKILITQQQVNEFREEEETAFYITNYKYLQILFYIKELYGGKDKEQLFNIGKYLHLPQCDQDLSVQFNKSAYLYLLTNQSELTKQSKFQTGNIFQFDKQEDKVLEKQNTKDYLEDMLEQINDKTLVTDAILDLLVNNKINHQYLKLFQQKYEILHQCMFFQPQYYFDEICKQVIKSGKQDQIINLVQQLQQLEQQYQLDSKQFTIQAGKFNKLKIRDSIVSANRILKERLGQYGFISKFCQQYADQQ